MKPSAKLACFLGSFFLVGITPSLALAEDAAVAAETPPPPPKDRGDKKWIYRWAPERNTVDIGIFAGLFFPAPDLELFKVDPNRPNQGHREFDTVLGDVGGRLAYFPSRFFGIEAEGAIMPTHIEDDGDRQEVLIWAARGHLVAQVGLWSVTPFVLAGATALGVRSRQSAVGNDVDASFHFGGGLKFFLNRWSSLRLEVRDTLSAAAGVEQGVTHNAELLLGVTFTLGRKQPPPVVDSDGDGILDPDDKCPTEAGVPEYDGCPIPDKDGDGVLDPDDACVDEPGVPEYDGCPIPDTDDDGILDPDDECVEVPGVPEFKGCPIPDTDGDGILDPDDKCPQEPETKNNIEDEDGCPDEIPAEVAKYNGVILGIYFDLGKDTISPKSRPALDEAVNILRKYPALRIEISGHTDDQGNDAYNQDLSQRRANSVKQYLTGMGGIDEGRVEVRGAGETEPIATNRTKAGRAQNRRIEFKLLQD